ncbi:MAG: hypothetical protein PUP46_07055 [Endozoicomonas sp. (ex Botrylloides leachii)]|nr:hypothetical protein [Endozoicomonas sp. (ex Botrylloides leachii)]
MNINDLGAGDILFFSSDSNALHHELDIHTSIVVSGPPCIYTLDLSIRGLVYEKVNRLPLHKTATAFYLTNGHSKDPNLFNSVAQAWSRHSQGITHSRGYFSRSFVYRFIFRSSSYGEKAIRYAAHLHQHCQTAVPEDLFSAYILCAYVPVALYQTIYGVDCHNIMALDAVNTTPHTLVQYLTSNPCWEYATLTSSQERSRTKLGVSLRNSGLNLR